MNVAVVAGEASGDRQASYLLRELSSQLPPGEKIVAWGIGGPCLADTGCEIIADSRSWGTIGVINSLSQPITLLLAMHKFKTLFKHRHPDLLILVDFGAFNVPLAKWVKSTFGAKACPIFYYFPPSSWRRKMSEKKLRNLTQVSDLIVTPFAWSADLLRSVGGNAHFVGHPLLDTVRPSMSVDEFDTRYGLDSRQTVISLLPGSREHEVQHILPVLLAAAGEITRRLPGVQFLVARSPNLPTHLIEDILRKAQTEGSSASLLHLVQQAGDLIKQASSVLKPQFPELAAKLATPEGLLVVPEDKQRHTNDWAEKRMMKPSQSAPLAIVENATHDALARADLVIAASGTATLESAILGRPPIIVYRGSSLMNLEYKIRRKALNLTYIGLPNILAEASICPEFVQDDATASAIANKALEMILQPEQLMQIKKQMHDVIAKNLGEAGATKRAASLLLDYLKGEQRVPTEIKAGANE